VLVSIHVNVSALKRWGERLMWEQRYATAESQRPDCFDFILEFNATSSILSHVSVHHMGPVYRKHTVKLINSAWLKEITPGFGILSRCLEG